MEIFEIYQIFLIFGLSFGGAITARLLYGSLLLAAGLWLILFVLRGIGLYTMAKKRSMKNKWLAFVPFASIYYMGKLVGTCSVFGGKMKRPGLYVMIAQLLASLVCAATIAAEILLFTKYADKMVPNESGSPRWPELTGFAMYMRNYYYYSDFVVSIVQLVYKVLLFILATGLYKKYTPKNYFLLSWVALLLPASVYIAVFVLRNRQAIDYEAYMRARREEFLRRSRQQNPYGPDPYNRNPYNQNPYNQNPYNQNPYNPYGGNANPYNNGPYGGAYPPPPNGRSDGNEDPFSEFASGASSPSGDAPRGGTGASDGGNSGSDDLFG